MSYTNPEPHPHRRKRHARDFPLRHLGPAAAPFPRLTQAELVRCVGWAQITINKIEVDERRSSLRALERLAAAMLDLGKALCAARLWGVGAVLSWEHTAAEELGSFDMPSEPLERSMITDGAQTIP